MNKIVHLGLFLAIVSAVAGGALAFANQMTAPVIAENNEREPIDKSIPPVIITKVTPIAKNPIK